MAKRQSTLRHCVIAWVTVLLAACGGRSPLSSEPPDDGGVSTPACLSGGACTPGGNFCQVGTTSCSSGSPSCGQISPLANGTPCGTNEVCLNGACGACVAGAACEPDGNPCETGNTSCSTGQPTCVLTGDVADGTPCGTDEMCCGGACAACEARGNATRTCSGTTCSFTCNAGFILCGSACVDATSDGSACGVSCTICPPGSTCVNSRCTGSTVMYGESAEFSPCGSTVGSFSPGDLLGQPVTVSTAITVNALGVFGNQPASGVEGILALYSDMGGAPSALLAFTASTGILAGKNEIPVLTPTALPAGTYWIVGEYSASASICTDNSTTNSVDFVSVTYGALPNPFGTTTALRSIDIDYYVVGSR